MKKLGDLSWLAGYIPPKTNDDGNIILKPEETWSTVEDRLANYNSKALNAIFNAVDANQFKLIPTYESTKDACKILETAYEGTSAVKISKK